MESLLNRYRSITILALVIFAQLGLLGYQVKTDRDVKLIRVWTVTAISPLAHAVDFVRSGVWGVFHNYVVVRDATAENRKLREELGRYKIENTFLKNELSTADRAKALQIFQSQSPSKSLAANVVGISPGSNNSVVFVNRGSSEGVKRGMPVVTPDGIVGKVLSAYPTASEVLLVTDPEFAAGVITKSGVRGTVKGLGGPVVKVDYVPYSDKVEPGDWFYTSGDDRIFPRGFVVGMVKSVQPAQPFKQILLQPSGMQHGFEDVLILLQVVHQDVPDSNPNTQPVFVAPPVPAPAGGAPQPCTVPAGTQPVPASPQPAAGGTDADKMRRDYQSVQQSQGFTYGEGGPGSKPPDFTKLGQTPPSAGTPQKGAAPGSVPGAAPKTGVPGAGPVTAPPKNSQGAAPAVTPPKSAPATAPSAAPAKNGTPGATTPNAPPKNIAPAGAPVAPPKSAPSTTAQPPKPAPTDPNRKAPSGGPIQQ
jgi:rod shape-determining protein MreC